MGADQDALNAPRVANRLLGRAEYYVRTRYHQDGRHTELDDFREFEAEALSRAYRRPPGHPDLVLWRLVKLTRDQPDGYRLTPVDAELVARSRMEYVGYWPGSRRKTVADAAAELGVSAASANMRRWRAEVLIARLMWRHTKGYDIPNAARRQDPAA